MNYKHFLIGTLAVAAVVASCEPENVTPVIEPELEVSKTQLAVADREAVATFTVKANNAWTVESDAEWLTVDPASGEASEEEVTVTATAQDNPTEEDRSANITVKSDKLTQTIKVTQSGRDPNGLYGTGTEADPYVLKTAAHVKQMHELSKVGGEVWFKLGADIDMASVTDYMPVNFSEDEQYDRKIHFDGDNRTISNFTCNYANYPSLFGVLYGTCKNLTMTNASITGTTSCGILAGYAGTVITIEGQEPAPKPAEVTNVSVQGKVESTAGNSGGMVGVAYGAKFTDCNVDVILNTSANDAGALAGRVIGSADFTGCDVKGVITSTCINKNRVGGFIGWIAAEGEVNITDCHVLDGTTLTDASNREKADNGNYGGFIGFGNTTNTKLTVKDCTVTNVKVEAGISTYNSTFIGGTGNYEGSFVDVADCSATGYVNGGQYCGGMAGAIQFASKWERCWTSSTVNGSQGQRNGGFIGVATYEITVKDCYATGDVYGKGQQIGGLIGYTVKATIENCYATGDVTSDTAGAAGLVGTINAAESSVINCIAWNEKIVCNRPALDKWAPGAIVGCVKQGTYKGGYRNPKMTLTDLEGGMVLVDQDDVVNGLPAAPAYSSSATQLAYHGKAAAADATVSSVAKSLGWDETVWDLSKDLPTLK